MATDPGDFWIREHEDGTWPCPLCPRPPRIGSPDSPRLPSGEALIEHVRADHSAWFADWVDPGYQPVKTVWLRWSGEGPW